jgi:peroxiredoxin
MNRPSHLVVVFSLLVFAHAHASPADGQRLAKAYQDAIAKWSSEIRLAVTPEDRAKVATSRPDPAATAKQVWAAISGSLDQESSLEPAAWFLRNTPSLTSTSTTGTTAPAFSQENDSIRKAIETHHLKSTKLIPVCAALATNSNPQSLALLEKIAASHPDPKIQGAAALAAALQYKNLGDEGEIMRKRLTHLRKAIVQSADVEFDDSTVAKIAEDELYIIRYLTKGRIAPDLVGVDSANRPLSLEANKGKIILLVFWNSNVPDPKRTIEIASATAKRFKGRPLTVIGVNSDPVEKLRALQADNTVTWTNFADPGNQLGNQYRVGSWPLVYVLDGDRKIHYVGALGSFAELTAEALLAEAKPQSKE